MNKPATEFEIKVSSGRITNVNAILENGICKLTIETVAQNEPMAAIVAQEKTAAEKPQDVFVLVEASKLSLEDEFMKYKPKTASEEIFKKRLTEVIKKGVKDFWRPKYDPSYNEDGTGICYVKGKRPAVGKSYNWWNKVAEAFCPERHSRLGTKSEYVAFLGVLIKKLIGIGWRVEKAWSAVCNDSRVLGHYWQSKNKKRTFEDTGSREICGFFDLSNDYKILAYDEEACGFWLAGGRYDGNSGEYPLANLVQYCNQNHEHFSCVGWVVMPAA